MKLEKEGRVLVGAVFEGHEVYANVNSAQQVLLHCPGLRSALVCEDVIWLEKAVEFGRRYGTTIGLPSATLDPNTVLAYTEWLKLPPEKRVLPKLSAPPSP